MSFCSAPDVGQSIRIVVDEDYVRVAADGTVFDVLLMGSLAMIDRNHDFFATAVADVAGFVVQFRQFVVQIATAFKVIVHDW